MSGPGRERSRLWIDPEAPEGILGKFNALVGLDEATTWALLAHLIAVVDTLWIMRSGEVSL